MNNEKPTTMKKNKKQSVFISGKISGEKIADCTMKFGAAQKELEAQGYEVLNPLSLVNDWETPWEKAMDITIKAVEECNAIYMLSDWRKSPGAKLEYKHANYLGRMILYQDEKEYACL